MIDLKTTNTRQLSRTPSPPVWPLPSLNGRAPEVIARGPKFPGLDLAYAREHDHDLIAKYPIGANGSVTHFMPDMMPAFCVGDGVISYAGKQSHGHSLVVDHCNGWATYYANLEHMFALTTTRGRARRERVKAGDVLGYIGAAVLGEMKCLHFELWKLGEDSHFEPVESLGHMRSWRVLPWTDERLTPTEAAIITKAA